MAYGLQMLRNTVIPETPMFKPEFPPQEVEHGVTVVEEYGKPEDRVATALKCLPDYDPATCWNDDLKASFRYWKIHDFAYAYRARLATPSVVADRVISALEELNKHYPSAPFFISFNAEDVRKQASASTQRFEEGNPISLLDGIFMAIKDDIDCYPHPSTGPILPTLYLKRLRSSSCINESSDYVEQHNSLQQVEQHGAMRSVRLTGMQ
ncbi:hypothetical protein Ancab_027926 [Ancistrocladus abbreviatus]